MVRIGGAASCTLSVGMALLFMVAGDFIHKRALIDRKPTDGDYFARDERGDIDLGGRERYPVGKRTGWRNSAGGRYDKYPWFYH